MTQIKNIKEIEEMFDFFDGQSYKEHEGSERVIEVSVNNFNNRFHQKYSSNEYYPDVQSPEGEFRIIPIEPVGGTIPVFSFFVNERFHEIERSPRENECVIREKNNPNNTIMISVRQNENKEGF